MKAIAEALKAKINEVKSEIEVLKEKVAELDWEDREAYEIECRINDLECKTLVHLRSSLYSMYQALQINVDVFYPENHEL